MHFRRPNQMPQTHALSPKTSIQWIALLRALRWIHICQPGGKHLLFQMRRIPWWSGTHLCSGWRTPPLTKLLKKFQWWKANFKHSRIWYLRLQMASSAMQMVLPLRLALLTRISPVVSSTPKTRKHFLLASVCRLTMVFMPKQLNLVQDLALVRRQLKTGEMAQEL